MPHTQASEWWVRDAQVNEAAVERLALLDDVILLQDLLEREALLVEHELRERLGRQKRAKKEDEVQAVCKKKHNK